MAEPLSQRQSEIIERARSEGRVRVEDLALRFEVTPQTIRKDLNELCERGMMQRLHGGAVLASGVENLGYDARQILAHDEKQAIGRRAAALIPNNSSLFINIGTTTEAVAQALGGHEGLMVITNNINVANTLRLNPALQVIIAGGVVRARDGGIVGEAAIDLIEQFKVDYAVIGTSAIDEEGTLYDYDYREVRVTQAIIQNARHVILVADSMKFERTAPVRIGHISQTNTFVTDHLPSEAVRQLCREAEVALVETSAPLSREAQEAQA
ncbi:DeoR/GlpR family DNA-binding transcription regulator [Limibacillus halophilus]|jgi:DeoR family glycerol-3-phosphate regulon repressor